MKEKIKKIIKTYLEIFPEEQKRQETLIKYIETHNDEEIVDWNNFDGHLVAGGFVYASTEKKFLVLYHKDLQMYLYPGGHMEPNDSTPLETAKREIKEETNLETLTSLKLTDEELIPFDIDTHIIPYNKKRNLPEHYHFDFRYLYTIKRIENVDFDKDESSGYKWIDIEELQKDVNYGKIVYKIKRIINK